MTDTTPNPIGNIMDAEDKLTDARDLAELIRMAQGSKITTPEAQAVANAACMIQNVLHDSADLLRQARAQLSNAVAS